MVKVKFLTGYRGYLTNEVYYADGTIAELEESTAVELAHRGIVAIDRSKPAPEPKADAKPAKRGK